MSRQDQHAVPLLLVGCGVSLLGDGMFAVALGFSVFALGGGPLTLGALLLVGTLAILVTILPAGALADRVDRRTLVVGSDIARGTAQLVSAALVAAGAAAWHLLLPALVFGIATGIHQPATQAFIGDAVHPERLERVNGLIQALRGIGMVTGAALAGLLAAHGSVALVVALDGMTFLACAACLAAVATHRGVTTSDAATSANASTGDQIRAGLTLVRTTSWLRRGTASAAGLVLVVYAPLQVAGPIAAREGDGATQWGTIASAVALGLILGGGSVSAGVVPRLDAVVRAFLVIGCVGPLALAVDGGTATFAVALIGFAALGAALGGFYAGWESRKQREIAPETLARIASVDWLCSLCCMIVGVALTSIIAATLGTSAMLVTMTLGCLALAPFLRTGASASNVASGSAEQRGAGNTGAASVVA